MDTDCWTKKTDAYVLVIMPRGTSSIRRFNRIRAWGALLALSMVTQREGLMYTSFGLAIALILGPEGFTQLSIEYIRLLNPAAAKHLEVWYKLPKDAPVPICRLQSNTREQNDLFSLICDLDLDVRVQLRRFPPAYHLLSQPRHIDPKRTPAGHDAWTGIITQCVLFGGSEFCSSQEFDALKSGFDYQLSRSEDGDRLRSVSTLLAIAHAHR